MRSNYKKIQFAIFAMIVAGAASAVDRSTAADAVEYMKKAQAYVKKNGMEKSLAEFNNAEGRFTAKGDINKLGDLYIYSVDPTGFQAIHKNPRIRGTNQLNLVDQDGVHFIREFVKLCFDSKEGKGWVNYRWPNPVTKEMAAKSSYVERVPGTDLCLGTGIYK
jgi:signal transduction histidine kinase